MKATTDLEPQTTLAARIAGEDISPGDFITVMNEVVEFPSFLWNTSPISFAPEEPVRIQFMAPNAGQPRKVIGVCLPFVYAKTPSGSVVTTDIRRSHLVRLDEHCARAVWDELKSPSKKKRK